MMKHGVRRFTLAFSAAACVASLVVGCTSNNGTTCTQNKPLAAPEPGAQAPGVNQCVSVGGQCMTANAGSNTCPSGMHLAPSGTVSDYACGSPAYGNDPASTNPCGPYYATGAPPSAAGFAAARIPCCLPGAEDGGVDGASDASDEADSPSSIGSCQGQVCPANCSCGVFPTTGQPTCFCTDAGAPDGGHDAAGPNCGTIYCFNGCTCTDFGRSACGCN
jgi:hypothetical protein